MNALKRLITIGMLAFCAYASAQQTTLTPHVGLQLPAYGSTSWQVPFYFDMNLIDQYIGGQKQFPFPNCTTNGWVLASTGSGWQCVPQSGGGGGGVNPGTQFRLGVYGPGGSVIVNSNFTTDISGNNLTIPNTITGTQFCPKDTRGGPVNFLCFGADPNGFQTGVGSDTAFQQAMLATNEGTTAVIVPAGNYLFYNQINVVSAFHSTNNSQPGGPRLIGAGLDTTVFSPCFTAASANLPADRAFFVNIEGNAIQTVVNIDSSGNMTYVSGNQFVTPIFNPIISIQTPTATTNYFVVATGTVNTTTAVSGVSSNIVLASGSPVGAAGASGVLIYINGIAVHVTGTNGPAGLLNGQSMTVDHDFGTQTGLVWAMANTTTLASPTAVQIMGTPPPPGQYTILWPQPYSPLSSGKMTGITLDGLAAYRANPALGCPGPVSSNRAASEAANGIGGVGFSGVFGGGFQFNDNKVQFFQGNGWTFATRNTYYPYCQLTSNGFGPDCMTNVFVEIAHNAFQYNGGWANFDGTCFGNSYNWIHENYLNQNGHGGVFNCGNQEWIVKNSISSNGCLAGASIVQGSGYVDGGTSGNYTYNSGTSISTLANGNWLEVGNVVGQLSNVTSNSFTLTTPLGALHPTPIVGTAIPWSGSCEFFQNGSYAFAKAGGNVFMARNQPSPLNNSIFGAVHAKLESNEMDSAPGYNFDLQAGDQVESIGNNYIAHTASLGFNSGGGNLPHTSIFTGGGSLTMPGASNHNFRSIEDHDRSQLANVSGGIIQDGTATTDGTGKVSFVFGVANTVPTMIKNDPIQLQDATGNAHQYVITTAPTADTTVGNLTWTFDGTTYTFTPSGSPDFTALQNNELLAFTSGATTCFVTVIFPTPTAFTATVTSGNCVTGSSGSGSWSYVKMVVGPGPAYGAGLPAANTTPAAWGWSLDYKRETIVTVDSTVNEYVSQMEVSSNSGNIQVDSLGGGSALFANLAAGGGHLDSHGIFILEPGQYGRAFTGNNFSGTADVATGANPTVTFHGTAATTTMAPGQPIWLTGMNCGDPRWPTQCHVLSITDTTHFVLWETNSGSALSNTAFAYQPPVQPGLTFLRGGCTTEPAAWAVMSQQQPGGWGWIQDTIITNTGSGCTSSPWINTTFLPYPALNNLNNYVAVTSPNSTVTPTIPGTVGVGAIQTQGLVPNVCLGQMTSSSQPTGYTCLQSDGANGLNMVNGVGNTIPIVTVGGPVFDITHYGAQTSLADNCSFISAANTAASAWSGPAILYAPLGVFNTSCAINLGTNVSIQNSGTLYLTASAASSFIRTGFGTGNTWGSPNPTYITGPGSFGCNGCNAVINIKQFAAGTVLEDFSTYGIGANGTSILIGDIIDGSVLPSTGLTIRNVKSPQSSGGPLNSVGLQVQSPATGVTGLGNYISGVAFGIVDTTGGNTWELNKAEDPNMVKCYYDKNTTAGVFSKYIGNVCNNPSLYSFHSLGFNAVVENNQFNCTAAPCVDNTETAMFFNQTDPLATISNNTISGGSSSSRWQFDTNILSTNMTSADWWYPGQNLNVGTTRIAAILSHQAPTGGGITSLNGLTGSALTIAGAGSNTVTQSGTTITITGAGGTLAPVVSNAGGDLACAMAADTTIGSQTVTAASSTSSTMTYTMASVPTFIYVGSVIGAVGMTPSGYNGGPYTVTSKTSTTVTVTSSNNPGTGTGFGTVYLWCANQTNDALSATPVTFANTYSIPANYFSSGTPLDVTSHLGYWSPISGANFQYALKKGTTTLYQNKGAAVMAASIAGNAGAIKVSLSGLTSTLVNADPIAFLVPTQTTTPYFFVNAFTGPFIIASGAETLSDQVYWAATGVVSATYVSGGTFTGSGTCALTFNNSSTGTGTLTVTAGVAGAIAINTRGNAATAAPTSGTVGTCTGATGTGPIVITSVLGGSPGNAALKRAFEVRTY